MKKILILMSVAMLFACTQGDAREVLDDQNTDNKTENPSEDSVVFGPGLCYNWGEFVVEDAKGLSLLNPSATSPLIINSVITVYCKKDGEYHTFNSLLDKSPNAPILDNKHGFTIHTPEETLGTRYVVLIILIHFNMMDYYNDKDIASTIVDWGNGVRDTIDVSIRKEIKTDSIYGYKYRNFNYDKMWINGKLVWDDAKADVLVDAISGGAARLVMSEGKTSSTAYSRLKALQ